jgi:hypothetical protein
MTIETPRPELTFFEKTHLLYVNLSALGLALTALLVAPFRGDWGASTYGRHVKYTALRRIMGSMTIRQSQYVFCFH